MDIEISASVSDEQAQSDLLEINQSARAFLSATFDACDVMRFMDGTIIFALLGNYVFPVGKVHVPDTPKPRHIRIIINESAYTSEFIPFTEDDVPHFARIRIQSDVPSAIMETPKDVPGILGVFMLSANPSSRYFVPLTALPSFACIRGFSGVSETLKAVPPDMAPLIAPTTFGEIVERRLPDVLWCFEEGRFVALDDGAFMVIHQPHQSPTVHGDLLVNHCVALVSSARKNLESYSVFRETEDGRWELRDARKLFLSRLSMPQREESDVVKVARMVRMQEVKNLVVDDVLSYAGAPTEREMHVVNAMRSLACICKYMESHHNHGSVFSMLKCPDVITLDVASFSLPVARPVHTVVWHPHEFLPTERRVQRELNESILAELVAAFQTYDARRALAFFRGLTQNADLAEMLFSIFRRLQHAVQPRCPSCKGEVSSMDLFSDIAYCKVCGSSFCNICCKPHMRRRCTSDLAGIVDAIVAVPDEHRKHISSSVALSHMMRKLLMSRRLWSIVRLKTDKELSFLARQFIRDMHYDPIPLEVASNRMVHDDATFGIMCVRSHCHPGNVMLRKMRQMSPAMAEINTARLCLSRLVFAICDIVRSEAEYRVARYRPMTSDPVSERALSLLLSLFGKLPKKSAFEMAFGAAPMLKLMHSHTEYLQTAIRMCAEHSGRGFMDVSVAKEGDMCTLTGLMALFEQCQEAHEAARNDLQGN